MPPLKLNGLDTLKFKITISREGGGSPFILGFFTNVDNYRTLLITPSRVTMATDKTINIRTYDNKLIELSLDALYKKDTPLFSVILQYTKMFGLIWDIDYINREIWIKTKSTYFKDYSVEDWSSKLDRTNDFTITPILFDSNKIEFNYEDNDGYSYYNYKEKYNADYGVKILYPEYDFNTETKKLFDGIQQSIVSSRTYIDFYEFYGWGLEGFINQTTSRNTIIEDADKDDKSPLALNNWFFRCNNITISPEEPTFITDDSDYQIGKKQKCYYSINAFDNSQFENDIVQVLSMPKFSVAYDGYGCIFNQPKEDYTYTGEVTNTRDYIYDCQWDKYINERYNIQNKKITTYFNLSPIDYLNFKFDKFVVLQNQLFMVNKIFDYQINQTSSLTKCELVQVSDLEAYTDGSLNISPIITNTDFVYINMVEQGLVGPNGNFQIVVDTQTKPTVTIGTTNVGSLILGMTRDGYNQYRYIFSYRNMGYTDETMISEITFTNEFGSVTIPVAIVGAGTAQITPNTYSVYSDSIDSYKSISFDSTPQPYTMLLSQTGGNMYYGDVQLVDVRNDSDTTIDGELEWTHVQDEIFIGEIFTRNAYVTQRIPVIIDTQDTQINCSDDFVYVQNVSQGTYILEFTSIEDDYTIELVEDKPTSIGGVSIISDEQWQGARYVEIFWSNFDVPCTWKGKLLVTNSKSTRIIPIILKITR